MGALGCLSEYDISKFLQGIKEIKAEWESRSFIYISYARPGLARTYKRFPFTVHTGDEDRSLNHLCVG
uniref:Uncharacterized protein n=1 Tax=Anguilla anguilla TaxID=7936 RepID=A0A0E9W4M5_ANGAN